ncbi:hypothetical protein OESDEN_07935 [Oesophagostomum dentatum]|uniref:Uncharacterized protein n=1 Tax=Oesophagostomum dentatum TaxID=61180 RepID=A0A0B1TA13_OESDE|nr:hypothetical protein OESDEN_07935 [Oesophagostomum dentatum]
MVGGRALRLGLCICLRHLLRWVDTCGEDSWMDLAQQLRFHRLIAEPQMELFRTHISPEFPDLLELASKCPLIMANTNDFYEIPRPTLAKVVNIGGIGIVSSAKPLPEASILIFESTLICLPLVY